MELDNLKEAWTALDNRLKSSEKLNESIILEMMRSKAGKLVNRFIVWEMVQFAGILLLIPVSIYYLDQRGGVFLAFDAFRILIAATFVMFSFWGAYKIHGLMKFDITENVGANILCMNRYNIQLKREKKFTYFAFLVLVIFAAYIYTAINATMPLWTFFVCMVIIGGLGSYWSYKKYDKVIKSILRSLDEIRELKEE